MFTIKICGITNPEDAQLVAHAGADAIGLNFYEASPRYVAVSQARTIVRAVPAGVIKVGLFVRAPADTVCRTFDDLGLDLIQLHGDEPPAFLAELGGRPVMKVFRLGPAGLPSVAAYLDECLRLECSPRLVLFDALVAKVFGGSGNMADWSAARRYREEAMGPPLVLAGGLTVENVAEAIRATGVRAVDTASGVESRPGKKDPAAVAAFVSRAREAGENVKCKM
jgi:phosphoribosylanthranilate isomerase